MKNRQQREVRRRPADREGVRRGSYSFYKSGVESRPDPRPEKTIDLRKVGRKVRLLPAVFAMAVIVGSILISLTLHATPSIEILGDQPSPYRSLDEYASATADIMGQSFGNRTKFTIQSQRIEDELISEYPELRAAVLRLPVLGRKPTLVLDIRQPAILLTTNNASFVLDNTGLVVSETRTLSAEHRTGLPVVRDQSGLELSVGKQAVTTDTIRFIQAVRAQLAAQDMKVAALTLPASGANELDVSIEGLDYFVRTDTAGDARLQIGAFVAVKQRLEREGRRPAEYIDVRVEEKVFYK